MPAPTHDLVEHFFRHEYGRLVANLTRAVGVARLELVEDVVQVALVRALQTWSHRGVPDDPAGWLYRVARNAAMDALRRDQHWSELREKLSACESQTPRPSDEAIEDDQLRLLFACCHPELPVESQVALSLKTLCGFSTGEIASGLLTTSTNIERRLTRAKEKLRELQFDPSQVADEQLAERLEAVRTVVYLLFNEGYYSSAGDTLIRKDVCEEAIRLARLLASHPTTSNPATFALLALLLFHAARLEARIEGAGQLLLEEQDRTKWNPNHLAEGLHWFSRSTSGDVLSRYHLEAAIASKHIAAATFGETDWPQIVQLYDLLMRYAPSPIHHLNRAVAIAQLRGPAVALHELLSITPEDRPANYSLWPAVVGELARRAGDWSKAREQLTLASQLSTAPAERELILRRLRACESAISHARIP